MKYKLTIWIIALMAVACSKEEDFQKVIKPADTSEQTLKSGVNNMSGFNWADARDNFVDGWVIPSGLSSGDDYSTVQSTADNILSGFQNGGANTVRLPINPPSVLESWWDSYKGAIDMARNKGMMVILACWESESSKNGTVDDIDQFWQMWDAVVNDYGSNSGVYFEVFNEPFGYSTSDLISLYNEWLDRYPNVPRSRILLGGSGYSEDVSNIGGSFPNCLLSQHLYAWWGNHTSVSAWVDELSGRVDPYSSRTILTEFGAPMTTGKNYNGSINGDAEIAFIQGMAEYCQSQNVASVYWPGLRDGDTYSMYTYNGSSLNLTNSSGLDRLHYGWSASGEECSPSTITPYLQVNGGSWQSTTSVTVQAGDQITFGPQPIDGTWSWSGCGTSGSSREQTITLYNSCSATATFTNDCGAESSVTFTINVEGSNDGDLSGNYRIINRNSGKCLIPENGSSADATPVVQYTIEDQSYEVWNVVPLGDGTYSIVHVSSGLYADINGASTNTGANNIIWPDNGGVNQRWYIEDQGNGYYHIVNVNSGLLLDISGASTSNNANNIQWTDNGGTNQEWSFVAD